jgi:hypothetical protein
LKLSELVRQDAVKWESVLVEVVDEVPKDDPVLRLRVGITPQFNKLYLEYLLLIFDLLYQLFLDLA